MLYEQGLDGSRRQINSTVGLPAFVAPNVLLQSRVADFTGTSSLVAHTFDVDRGSTGPAVTLAESTLPVFSVSQTGVLVYRSAASVDERVVWLDREGRPLSPPSKPLSLFTLDLARDNERLAFADTNGALFVHDLGRGVSTRVTAGGTSDVGATDPVWSPDGDRIAYAVTRATEFGWAVRPASGGNEQFVLRTKTPTYLDDWSADGRFLAGHTSESPMRGMAVRLEGGDPIVFAESDRVDEPRFSPDTRWIAYEARDGRADEVFLTTFPPTGERWQLSVAGGAQPRWNRNGTSIYYLTLSGTLMQVDVRLSPGKPPQISAPRRLFATGVLATLGLDQYAPASDDSRILFKHEETPEARRLLHVIVNWREMLNPLAAQP